MSPCFSLILLAIDLDNSTISLAYQETHTDKSTSSSTEKSTLKTEKTSLSLLGQATHAIHPYLLH